MSHFTCLVIGPNPESQLQPFHEYECTGIEDEFVVFVEAEEDVVADYEEHKSDYSTLEVFAREYHGYHLENGKWGRRTNPNKKWDWYVLGGRWEGFFLLNSGIQADQALKRDIDFAGMIAVDYNKAANKYDNVLNAVKGTEESIPWLSVRDERFPGNIEQARDFYGNQPRVKAFNKAFPHSIWDAVENYQVPKEVYAQQAGEAAVSPFSIIKDGVWYEKGKMGWWGMVSNPKDSGEWNKQVNELIASLPEVTLMSLYDCHI